MVIAFSLASKRLRTLSFASVADTWCSTVRVDATSLFAISALRSPPASRTRTSGSRSLSPLGLARVVARGA